MDAVEFLKSIDSTLFSDYIFNSVGHHSPKHVFKHLNEDELKHVARLLRSERHHRHIEHWTDVGDHKEPIRMLLKENNVYAVFRINKHVQYEKMLNSGQEFEPWSLLD